MTAKPLPICDTHVGQVQSDTIDTCLVCDKCGTSIPASAAISFEGSDYVRHFCGDDCLFDWCSATAKLQDRE